VKDRRNLDEVLRQPALRQSGPVPALFRAYGRRAGVVSLALLFALAAIVLLTERSGADVMLSVRDSAKMAQNANPVELGTSDTEQAEQWLKQHMGFTPRIPSPSGFKLVGARSCHINSEPVGLLLFERDGQWLSCYVGRSWMTALHGFDDATPEGIRLGTCEGRHVAAWDAGDLSYLLVTDLTKDVLLAVANEVANGTSQSLKQ
jgi:anti-sigma factor RsiW